MHSQSIIPQETSAKNRNRCNWSLDFSTCRHFNQVFIAVQRVYGVARALTTGIAFFTMFAKFAREKN